MIQRRILGELVTFRNSTGLELDGILYQKKRNKTTIVHIHGSLGNFFHNHFLREMARMYLNAGINFLSFNLSCHDGFAEGFYEEDELKYIGGAVTSFSTCISDIEAAITFVKQFSKRVVLQGHSLGCDRILYFLTTKHADHDFILLGPCDSYQLQANWIAPETIEEQIIRIKNLRIPNGGMDWLPLHEYGIKQSDWVYSIPITRNALLSIMEGPPFQLIRIKSPIQYYINQRCFVYIGGCDPIQVHSPEVMFCHFEQRIKQVTRSYIPHGDHSLGGCEQEVIKKIIKWIQNNIW